MRDRWGPSSSAGTLYKQASDKVPAEHHKSFYVFSSILLRCSMGLDALISFHIASDTQWHFEIQSEQREQPGLRRNCRNMI